MEMEEGMDGDAVTGNVKQAKIRKDFADLAYWNAMVLTDDLGRGKISFKMPENLTAWKARCWAVGTDFIVGEAEVNVTTSKKLLLRLQAPRFFVETDEVVLSANVHNYLTSDKTVKVSLEVNSLLSFMGKRVQEVLIKAGGEARIDWRMKVMGEGKVVLKAFALSDEESDAVQMDFPAKVHGMLKMDSFSGVIRPKQDSGQLRLILPQKMDPRDTMLELRYSPTLAATMIDALPYLVSFPYGCTEQTLNRFLPTTITRKVLQEMDLDLEEIQGKMTNLNAQEIGEDNERMQQWKQINPNYGSSRYGGPVFDSDLVARMEKVGLERLQSMQVSDGGWGWFSGSGEHSYPHTTATVVRGLMVAKANGAKVNESSLKRGLDWLEKYQQNEVIKIRNYAQKKEDVPRKAYADNMDALIFMVLTKANRRNEEMESYLYEHRNQLAVYGKSILALAFHQLDDKTKVEMLKRNIEQFLKIDNENQTAYLELGNGSYWYYWYGSEWEAHAYYLKLLAAVDPKGKTAPMLVKYLINNRRHATYWNSTRDTALCIEAMADYLRASGEMAADMEIDILLDGKLKKTVKINRDNLFTFDNRLVLDSEALGSGEHKLELRRRGVGPLYFNAYLSYFSKQEYIKKAGLEVKVNRTFYKLIRKEASSHRAGKDGRVIKANEEAYQRIELADLATLKSGDLVEVELEVESKNDYEYLVIEDLKAAGFEALEVRSGYRRAGGLYAYQEMRNDRVAFLVSRLPRGKHNLSYRLRAETPGRFSALPAKIYANYAPELKGNSDEIKFNIEDVATQAD